MSSEHPAVPPLVAWPWLAVAAAIWIFAFALSSLAPPPLPEGPFEGRVSLIGPPRSSEFGRWVLAETSDTIVLLEGDVLPGSVQAGFVSGTADGKPGEIAGRRYASSIVVASYTAMPGRLEGVAAAIRDHIDRQLEPYDDGRALVAGFLIGDTSHLDPVDEEAMRRSGLAHFVAVSGSNVALFLTLVFLALGPLALGPRRRAVFGLASLPIYAAVTGFEPSVMRASVMAAIALTGRLVGILFEAWQLLALAVGGLLILEPSLSRSAGFQLSVVATAGVLVGARWPIRGRLKRALAVTLGAQLAVAPLILWYFGSVPLFSPVLNLLAAPLVTVSTAAGAVGMIGIESLVSGAGWLASLVLDIASIGAGLPQLSAAHFFGVVAAALLISRFRSLVGPSVVMAGVGAASVIVVPSGLPPPGSVVVLDVGQGDAILLHGGDGRYALVDGGPDQVVLVDALRRHGVSSLEFVVLSHVHADHVSGLVDIDDRLPVGSVLMNTDPHVTSASAEFFDGLEETPVVEVNPGDSFELGILDVEVAGPHRRFASPNDQSVLLIVTGPRKSMLLAGDIEAVAQRELAHLRADVLKVPHQGAATSDADWLRNVGAELAVISVGPNQFGHPAEWVIETLDDAGAEVLRTDRDGDVVVDLS